MEKNKAEALSPDELVKKYSPMIYRLAYTRLQNVHDAEDITQEVLLKSIISDTVTSDMDMQQKVLAIYSYLVNNAVYDRDALEAAEENGFVKAEGWEFEDAFNTYGVLVAKKGVCMSYAYAFRLLCDLGGVDCTVVTGFLDGSLPHAWNMVSIDGKYYEVDCTNNAVNTGIPYYLYQADSGLAEASGYRKDDMFWVDSGLSVFDGDDESLEYYRQNGLCPESMQELKEIITENVTEDTAVFAVRWQGEIDKEEFDKTIILAYNELGLEDKLKGLKYTVTGSFIVLINE